MTDHRFSSPRPATRRSAALLLTASALATTAGIVGAAPALASDRPEIVELSADGSTYSRSLTDLLGPSSLVPLGQAADSFWVRNGGTEPAYLAVSVTDVNIPDPDVARAVSISAATAAAPGTGHTLDQARPCLTLVAGQVLGPGESVEVHSALALADLDGRQGQDVPIGFALQAVLSERQLHEVGDTECSTDTTGPGTTTPPGPTTPNPGGSASGDGSIGKGPAAAAASTPRLPVTGAQFAAVAGTAAALLIAGLALRFWLAARRRRDDEQPE